MTTNSSGAPSIYTVAAGDLGDVEVSVTERGSGQPVLLLHGGAGPQSVTGFADLLAATDHCRVVTPTHPGFGATLRPETLRTVAGLARVYAALLDHLAWTGSPSSATPSAAGSPLRWRCSTRPASAG